MHPWLGRSGVSGHCDPQLGRAVTPWFLISRRWELVKTVTPFAGHELSGRQGLPGGPEKLSEESDSLLKGCFGSNG